MPPRRIYTPAAIRLINEMVQRDASAKEIAEAIGTDERSLRVRCSQLNISLKRGPHRLRATVDDKAIQAFEREASKRNVTLDDLLTKVLTTIASENLFRAVLDD